MSGALAILFGCIYPFVHDPVLLPLIGFALTVPIYVLVALLFAIYIPELFPTEVRLRAAGICNTVGRGATIGTPFLVVWLFSSYGIVGVLSLMVALLFTMVVVVLAFGVESGKRSLERIDDDTLPNLAFEKA
jgi:putative MFS transporter